MTRTRAHREGFRDAIELFDTLEGDETSEAKAVELVAAAEPPAMSDEYRAGFRQATNILRKAVKS